MRKKWLVAGALVAVAVVAVLAFPLFAPHGSTEVRQALPAGEEVKRGTFHDGEPGHNVEGTVRIVRGAEGFLLRFEGYQATDGPDVYFYLTSAADPRTTEQVEGGLRVLVPGGAGGGEATLRGDFNVPLPAGFDPSQWSGMAAWCDRFNVLFGAATLA